MDRLFSEPQLRSIKDAAEKQMPIYEFRCKSCNKLLGYMANPNNFNSTTTILTSTSIYGDTKVILCPSCENKRFRQELLQLDGIVLPTKPNSTATTNSVRECNNCIHNGKRSVTGKCDMCEDYSQWELDHN